MLRSKCVYHWPVYKDAAVGLSATIILQVPFALEATGVAARALTRAGQVLRVWVRIQGAFPVFQTDKLYKNKH